MSRRSSQERQDEFLSIALGTRRRPAEGRASKASGKAIPTPEEDRAHDVIREMTQEERDLWRKYLADAGRLAAKRGG